MTNTTNALQILEWFGYHNSNLTKEQYHQLDALTEAVRAIRLDEMDNKTVERIKELMHNVFNLAWFEARRTEGQRLTDAELNKIESDIIEYALRKK